MAFAGGVGADLIDEDADGWPLDDEGFLFSESCSRFVLEVRPENLSDVLECLERLPVTNIGNTVKEPRLRIVGRGEGEWIIWASLAELKEAWQKPLRW